MAIIPDSRFEQPRLYTRQETPFGEFVIDQSNKYASSLMAYLIVKGNSLYDVVSGQTLEKQGASSEHSNNNLGQAFKFLDSNSDTHLFLENESSEAYRVGTRDLSILILGSPRVLQTSGSQTNALIMCGAGNSGGKRWEVLLYNNNLRMIIDDDSIKTQGESTSDYVSNEPFTSMITVKRSGNCNLYKDGNSDGSFSVAASSGDLDMSDHGVYLGATNNIGSALGNFFEGKFNAIALWDKELDSEAAKDLYLDPYQLLAPR